MNLKDKSLVKKIFKMSAKKMRDGFFCEMILKRTDQETGWTDHTNFVKLVEFGETVNGKQ